MDKFDITGQRFGMLTILEKTTERSRSSIIYLCQCDCGVIKKISREYIIRGKCISCGCYRNTVLKKHGMTRTPTYKTWQLMIVRCNKPTCKQYKYYGGKGVKVCDRWLDKEKGFINFLSDMGERPHGKTIDRIDNNGNYCPENCRWSDSKTQNRNRSCSKMIEYNGIVLNLSSWAEKIGMIPITLNSRLIRGWTIEDALNKPIIKNNI